MTVLAARTADASLGVVEVDVSEPLPTLVAMPPLGCRCLVRAAGQPLGYVDLRGPERLPAAALAAAIRTQLDLEALTEDGMPVDPVDDPAPIAPTLSVVIATRDRPAVLDECLASLVTARPAPAEVIVVDNAPSDDRTRDLVGRWAERHPWIHYVREDRPGLGAAHNAALPHVTTELVAFTDDDVLVDHRWVGAIVDAFETTPHTVAVTGLIAPRELRTAEQWWIERSTGFGKGFERRVRSLRDTSGEGVLFPYDAGTLGSGANMAFRTWFLRGRDGFDATLGTGTRSLGGDDLEALHAVVAAGHDLVYEPAAIVRHRHHDALPALERQARGYGAGLTAYLTATVVRRPRAALDIVGRIGPGVRHALAPSSPLNARRPADYPRSLVWRERAGMASGPARYLWQRAIDRRRHRSAAA